MMAKTALALKDDAPLLLRRARPRPVVTDVRANMTVVTTQGNQPEMHDQQDDPTAPRND
jgi:hypothetical protein